jgi:hypothetical protein
MLEKQQQKLLEQLMSNRNQLESEVEGIEVEASVRGVTVKRKGNSIESIEIDGEERDDVKKALNKADKLFKKKVNRKLRKMLLSGVKIPGLR